MKLFLLASNCLVNKFVFLFQFLFDFYKFFFPFETYEYEKFKLSILE